MPRTSKKPTKRQQRERALKRHNFHQKIIIVFAFFAIGAFVAYHVILFKNMFSTQNPVKEIREARQEAEAR